MTATAATPDGRWTKRFQKAVTQWYATSGRDLPWKHEHDPYRVWVREIMLQQTTVVAVVPYLERFLKAFPTLQSLANASEHDVLRIWEGLGYYSRARNLRKAAQAIVDNFDGKMPTNIDEIHSLPGIGRYTAGAIASFAFGQPAPILEANTARLYARLTGLEDDLTRASSRKSLWAFAAAIVPQKSPGTFNQALMDIGATVCRPKEPLCSECPVVSFCIALATNRVDNIPVPKKRPEVTHLVEVCVAIRRGNEVLLQQRDETEWWSGLWDFPRFRENGIRPDRERMPSLASESHEATGLHIGQARFVETVQHAVTRYRITLHCYVAAVVSGRKRTNPRLRWVRLAELQAIPLTKTARRFADRILENSDEH